MILKIAVALLFTLLPNALTAGQAPGSLASMCFLYPSLSGTFAASWIAKEAGYFAAEGLDIE